MLILESDRSIFGHVDHLGTGSLSLAEEVRLQGMNPQGHRF